MSRKDSNYYLLFQCKYLSYNNNTTYRYAPLWEFSKLSHYGIRGVLTEIHQQVTLNGTTSLFNVYSLWCLRGSLLGPMFIKLIIKCMYVCMYVFIYRKIIKTL